MDKDMAEDALLDAIQTRDVDRVAALLAAGADPNEDGKSRYANYGSGRELPLQAAIGELQAFEAIGPYGPEPAGPIDSIVLLLRHGAKVKGWDVDNEGDPLFLAVGMNHIEAVRLLLAHGADPNVRDNEGDSPLRFCIEKEYLEMARLLLLCGANKNINKTVGGGMTALGLAAYWLNVEMVKLLLAHGADPHVEDIDRMTVFEHLRHMDLPEDPADQDRLRETPILDDGLVGDPGVPGSTNPNP
ncbi:MAG: ankyrin repeat domain-containing protein [Polyangiaceae bacterium]|nr:ankyrin repeat domain-containing protein [Polyangiaceae bacterium]